MHEGHAVKAGDVLFRVDDRAWKIQRLTVDQAENALAVANLKIKEADNDRAKHEKAVEAQNDATKAAEAAAEAARIGYEEKNRLAKMGSLDKAKPEAAGKLWDQAKAAAAAEKAKGEALLKRCRRDRPGEARGRKRT